MRSAPEPAPSAPKRVTGGGRNALDGVSTHQGPRRHTPRRRTAGRRHSIAGALALVVAVLSSTGTAATAGAQEPSGGDQVVCPEFPVQAPGAVFGPTVGDVPVGNVDFRCANLQGATFEGLTLIQTQFDGANLSGATFTRSRLGQADLRGANLQQARFVEPDLIQAHFDGADLRGASVEGGTMTQAELPGANLVGATLTDVDLGQANLEGARMAGIDATDSRFAQSSLDGADLTDAVLRDAVLTQTGLTGATMTGADLTDATAFQTRMQRADLTGADLTNASFNQAMLEGANLTGATVTGAEFIQSNLSGATIDDVVGASETFPRMAWLAVLGGVAIVTMSIVGLVLRFIRRQIGPVNPYDSPMTAGRTTATFVLVPVFAVVQAVGLYLLVCGVAGVLGTNLNPLGTQSGAPVIGDLAFQPTTIVYGTMLLMGGGFARGFARRF